MGQTETKTPLNPEVSAKPKKRVLSAKYKQRVLRAAEAVQKAGGERAHQV